MKLSFENIKEIEKKWQKRWEEEKVFESNISKKKKFFVTFPYPYVNGAPHIGHSFTLFRIDSYARFKRLQGFNVLYPQSFHATGEPILGAIERLKQNDQTQIETFKMFGASDEDIKNFVEKGAEYTARYWMKKWIEMMKKAGISVDWRRTFITAIDPIYNKFVEWQYNTLRKKGYVAQGTHPVVWCPKCQSPTGDHDRLKGEGESPIEYFIIKFYFDKKILPCATLRPETIYGVTNIWIKSNTKYSLVKVGEEEWIVSKETIKKLKDQLKKVEEIGEIDSNEIIGKNALNPITKEEVPILPASFIDLDAGTGIVMSVPAHAPYDFIALEDLKKDEALVKKFNLEKIVPKVIIKLEGLDIPAKAYCKKYGIKSQEDKEKLEKATREVYKKEFHLGKMIVEDLKEVPVKDAKKIVIEKLKEINSLDSLWELTGEVICRCKTKCYVKILENQWFLKFSDENWKKKVKEAISKMRFYPEEIREQFLNTVDWLENKACTRKTGLGTKLPWDKEWIVETLSDSTIYMSLYTIYHLIKNLDVEKIKDSFFDYIFLGLGELNKVSKENFVDKKILEKARKEFEYFYPVDFRGSGKDLVQNHLTFYIFHHVAIWDEEKYWPRIIGVNGFVNVAGEKMSKSKGNIIPLEKLIESYGSDLVRINIISSAENLDDADWRFERIQTFLGRINFLFDLIESLESMQDRKKMIIDSYILNFVTKKILEAEKAYEELRFKTACQLLIFDVLNEVEWYLKRVGGKERANKKIMKNILENLARAISPLLPHLSEEMWSLLGKKEFIFSFGYPKIRKIVDSVIDIENFVKKTFEDIKEIIKITQIKPKKAYIILASDWKFDLYEKFLNNEEPEMEDFLKYFEEKELPAKVYKKFEEIKKRNQLVKTIKKEDQEKILKGNKEFFEREFGCEFKIVREEDIQFEKKKQALPFKPSIYFLT